MEKDEENSVCFNEYTFDCASLATGCLLTILDDIYSGKCLNGAAIIRPPGHHSTSEASSGFCYFNSIAVAAKYALKKYNSQFEK